MSLPACSSPVTDQTIEDVAETNAHHGELFEHDHESNHGEDEDKGLIDPDQRLSAEIRG